MTDLEPQIAEWRAFVGQRSTVKGRDIEELEDHLRTQIAELAAAGLDEDEAFLVAVKRMGRLDELSHEFAQVHRERLWKQLISADSATKPDSDHGWLEAFLFALGAAAAVLVVRLIAGFPDQPEPMWLLRNAGLLVLPFLAAYFARRRRIPLRRVLLTAAPFVALGLLINIYPYGEGSSTEMLVAAHLPIVLWFVIAYPYASGSLRSHERRMDYVRFTGEWFIYYVLIALGGMVLLALTTLILEPTTLSDPEVVLEWVIPSGAAAGVIMAAWLVESKQRVIENMAPVLTMLFTPLFAVMLAAAAVVYLAAGLGAGFDRELLGVFDALLVVVLGLVLYGVSARDPDQPPGWMDRFQLFAVVGALVLDAIVLWTMIGRIAELGFTPNRAAALGLNLVLLVNLAGTAWISTRFLTGKTTFLRLERWQTNYLPAFAAWAGLVVIALPPLFGFS